MVSTRAQRQQRKKDLDATNQEISPLLPPGLEPFFGKSDNLTAAVTEKAHAGAPTTASTSRGGARTRGTDVPRGKAPTRGKKAVSSDSKKSAGGVNKRGGRRGGRKLSDGKHDYSPRGKGRAKGQGRSKSRKTHEVQDEAIDGDNITEPTTAVATAEVEPEPQRDPCEEFAARVDEAKARLATSAAGATELENPAIAGEQLENMIIDRAIASVTEAFGMDGPVFSLMHTDAMRAVLTYPPNDVAPAHFHVVRPGHEAFIPRYKGGHISLYVLRYLSPRGAFDMVHHDSSRSGHHRGDFKEAAGSIRRALGSLHWDRDFPTLSLTEEVGVASMRGRQRERWECGVYVILFAWAYALGLDTNGFVDICQDRYDEFLKQAIELINLAIQGQASSRMIEAFLKCFGFVQQNGTVSAQRHFDSTHAFTGFYDLASHIARQLHRENLNRLRGSGMLLQNRAGLPLTLPLLLADLGDGELTDIVFTSTADLLKRHQTLLAAGAATNLAHLVGQLAQVLPQASNDQADAVQSSAQEEGSQGPSGGQSAVASTSPAVETTSPPVESTSPAVDTTSPAADQGGQPSSGATSTRGSKRAHTSADDGAPSKKQKNEQQEDLAENLIPAESTGSAVAAADEPASDQATGQPPGQPLEAQQPSGQVLTADGDTHHAAGFGAATPVTATQHPETPGAATQRLETPEAANRLLDNMDAVSTPESSPTVLEDAEVDDHTIPVDVQCPETNSQERTYISPGGTQYIGSPPSREYGDENVAFPPGLEMSSSPMVSGVNVEDVFGPRPNAAPAAPAQNATSDENAGFSPPQDLSREEPPLPAAQTLPAATEEVIEASPQSDTLPVPGEVDPTDSLSLFGDCDEVPPAQAVAEIEVETARRPEGLRLDASPTLPASPRRGLALPPPTPLNTASPSTTNVSLPGLYLFGAPEASMVPNVTEEDVTVSKDTEKADVEDGIGDGDDEEEL